jgi:hypothetical protein
MAVGSAGEEVQPVLPPKATTVPSGRVTAGPIS